jgi:hypothetical protein
MKRIVPTLRGALAHHLFFTVIMITVLSGCGDSKQKSVDEEQIKASIEAFKNRKIYHKLDVSTLRQIPDEEIELAIVDYVGTKIQDRYEREVEIVRSLSQGIRALYVTWWVEAEVNNGGFNQYFWNRSGAFAKDAVLGFEFFGAHDHAALMREAIAIETSEQATMKKFTESNTPESFSRSYDETKLNELDKKFYKIGDNLRVLRIKAIREKPELFTGQ